MRNLSTWVVTLAPMMSMIAPTPSANLRRISAMNPTTAMATSTQNADIAFRTVLTGPSMRSCPMLLPLSATVSSNWPCSDRTKNRQTSTNPATSATASTINHRTSPYGLERMPGMYPIAGPAKLRVVPLWSRSDPSGGDHQQPDRGQREDHVAGPAHLVVRSGQAGQDEPAPRVGEQRAPGD